MNLSMSQIVISVYFDRRMLDTFGLRGDGTRNNFYWIHLGIWKKSQDDQWKTFNGITLNGTTVKPTDIHWMPGQPDAVSKTYSTATFLSYPGHDNDLLTISCPSETKCNGHVICEYKCLF